MATMPLEFPLDLKKSDPFASLGLDHTDLLRKVMNDAIRSAIILDNRPSRRKNVKLPSKRSNYRDAEDPSSKYLSKCTQHANSYVQMYDQCGRPVHIGKEIELTHDLKKDNNNHLRFVTIRDSHKHSKKAKTKEGAVSSGGCCSRVRLRPVEHKTRSKQDAHAIDGKPPSTHHVCDDSNKKRIYVSSSSSSSSENATHQQQQKSAPSIKLYVNSCSNIIETAAQHSPHKTVFLSPQISYSKDDNYPTSVCCTTSSKLTVPTSSIDSLSIKPKGQQQMNIVFNTRGSGGHQDDSEVQTSNAKCRAIGKEEGSTVNHRIVVSIPTNTNNKNKTSSVSLKRNSNTKCIAEIAPASRNGDNNHVKMTSGSLPAARDSSQAEKKPSNIPIAPPLPAMFNSVCLTNMCNSVNADYQMVVECENSFPWEKLDREKIRGTVWEKCKRSFINPSELADLERNSFWKTNRKLKKSSSLKRDLVGCGQRCRGCLRHKKAYNLAIIIGGLKKPVADIAGAVRGLDADSLSSEVITHLLQYGPDDDEIKELLAVPNPSILEKPDHLAYMLLQIPRCEERLNLLLLRSTFDEKIDDIHKSMRIISDACITLKTSDNVRSLIELVLMLGNWLNKDSDRYGQAHGFKVDVLTKLDQTRIKSKHVSVMNLLMRLTKKHFKKNQYMNQEIQILNAACTIDIQHIDEQIKQLQKTVEDGDTMVEDIKKMETTDIRHQLNSMLTFFGRASDRLVRLKQNYCALKDMFVDVRKYFGDDSKDVKSDKFFTTFRSFLSYFQTWPEL